MLVDTHVEVGWNPRMAKHYINLGYPKHETGETFTVLISHLPPGSGIRVKVRCPICSKKGGMKYADYVLILKKFSTYKCKYCRSQDFKISTQEAKQEFIARGLVPTFEKYEGTSVKLSYVCPEHPTHKQSMAIGTLRQGHGCKYCGITARSLFLRLEEEFVISVFNSKNYTPTFTSYKNAVTPLSYVCNIHPDKGEQTIRYNDLQQGGGCYYCGVLRYKNTGGICKYGIPIGIYLRRMAVPWKHSSIKFYNKTCPLTKRKEDLNVHHIVSFNTLLGWAHSASGIAIRILYEDYTKSELGILNKLVSYYHAKYIPLGIPLHREIHKFYHELYGYENTLDQWLEFENNYFKVKGIKHDAYSFN